eukprot:COSAG03_NODE_92_length_13295_cov_193.147014_12_plen_691_part_00
MLLAKAQTKADLPAPYDYATIGELRVSKFEALPQAIKKVVRSNFPNVVHVSTDGGSDHKNTSVANQASILACQIFCQIGVFILFRNCRDGSWINAVERCNSILNLGLYHKAFCRAMLATLEALAINKGSMDELREKAHTLPQLKSEWEQAMQIPCAEVAGAFNKLSLGEKPFHAAVTTSTALDVDVAILQRYLRDEAPDYTEDNTTQASLSKMPQFQQLLDKVTSRSNYAFQSRMEFDRTPEELRGRLRTPIPMPHFETPGDEHFPSYARQRQLQLLADTARVDDRDMPSRTSKPKLVSEAGRKVDQELAKTRPNLWAAKHVVAGFECASCAKPRTIHSVASTDEQLQLLRKYLDLYPPICGVSLVEHRGIMEATYKLQQADTCASQVRAVFYSWAQQQPPVGFGFGSAMRCVNCGTGENLIANGGECDGATGRKLRPQYNECSVEGKPRVPHGRARSVTVSASRRAAVSSVHVDAHASAGARVAPSDVIINSAAALAARKAAEAHIAAQARAVAEATSLSTPAPMQMEIEEGQEQMAKRQRPRRGYVLDTESGQWYNGNVAEQVGAGTFRMQYDGPYATETNIVAHRLVADGDTLHVTWLEPAEAADPDPDLIYICEVSIRNFGREKDVVFLVNPQPTWELDEDTGKAFEYTVNLNPSTAAQRAEQPHYSHTRAALEEKLAALVVNPGE